MAPTLVTACTALPPEGAVLAWGGPALADMAPTLVTACTALPPEGAVLAWGGPALADMAPTRPTVYGSLHLAGRRSPEASLLSPEKVQLALKGAA
jgi:hypothetical protein